MKTINCGLDVASTSVRACVMAGGVIVAECDLTAGRAGEDQLLAKVPAEAAVYLESTGRYHLPWARRLAAAGRRVYVLNALLAKRLVSSHNALRQNKTDAIDARELAQIGERDGAQLERYRFQEDPSRTALRALNRVRFSQRQQLTDTLRSANSILGTMLPEAPWLDLTQGSKVAELFLEITSLAQLQGKRTATLDRQLGERGPRLHQVLRGPLSGEAVFDALLPALQAQLVLIRTLRAQQEAIVKQLATLAEKYRRSSELQLIQSIPGFGAKTAAALLAFLPNDLRQWGRKQQVGRKLQAYFGFDPRLRQSGLWRGRVRMTKRGDPIPRTALFQAAVCAIMHDEPTRALFRRKQAEGKPYRVAVSHVMRIQLRRLVAVLYDQRPFTPNPPPPPIYALHSL